MKMKRRKRRRKPKQDSKPREQAVVRGEIKQPESLVAMPVGVENSASPVVMSGDTEKPAPDSAAPTGADRRTHPRYAFIASVEVVAAEPDARIKTRVRDLSLQGCYVDTDSPLDLGTTTNVHITKGAKSFEARARVVYNQPSKGMGLMFTAVEPEQFGTLDTWIAESRETSWLAANRRRSQRVLIRIPVRVSGQLGVGSTFEEETCTLAISAHGALLVVAAPVYRGQRFTLSNVQTKAALECIVVHVDRFPGEQIQVGVEFMLPNPTFWRVAFPPKDWTPRHPDAKSG
jgi:PilZ domain